MNICTKDGVFCITDPVFETLGAARAFVQEQSDVYAAYKRATFLDPISPYEASSWPLKLAEAQAYPVCPSLTIEAAARGVDLPSLVTKVLTTIEDCIAYDWQFEV